MQKKDYDKKLFRLIKILNVIQSSKATNTAELAEEFNISRRTAQRDIARLMAAGFPIIEDETQKGLYRFCPGYSLRGLSVSDEEVSLLVSLCDVAKHMGGDFDKAYKNIFAKVMNTGEWDSPFFVMMPKAVEGMADEEFRKTAESAVSDRKRVRMVYKPVGRGRKELVLEPLKLIYYEGFWYMAARVPMRNWIIKIRLDRIHKLEVLEEKFKPHKSLVKILQESQSIWFSEKRDKRVRIKVSSEVVPYFFERKHLPRQKVVKRSKDGSVVIEAVLCHYMEAIPLIYRWIPHLTVLSPKDLAEDIRGQVAAYLKTL